MSFDLHLASHINLRNHLWPHLWLTQGHLLSSMPGTGRNLSCLPQYVWDCQLAWFLQLGVLGSEQICLFGGGSCLGTWHKVGNEESECTTQEGTGPSMKKWGTKRKPSASEASTLTAGLRGYPNAALGIKPGGRWCFGWCLTTKK